MKPNVRETVSMIALLSVLAAALFVILAKKYDDAVQKWAFGAVGSILTVLVGAVRRRGCSDIPTDGCRLPSKIVEILLFPADPIFIKVPHFLRVLY